VAGSVTWNSLPVDYGLHHCPEIHLRKKLQTHLFGYERSWGLL